MREPREDCDLQCVGYYGDKPCCGGCPAQCHCRAESENDAAAEREDQAERDYYDGDAETEYGDGPGA